MLRYQCRTFEPTAQIVWSRYRKRRRRWQELRGHSQFGRPQSSETPTPKKVPGRSRHCHAPLERDGGWETPALIALRRSDHAATCRSVDGRVSRVKCLPRDSWTCSKIHVNIDAELVFPTISPNERRQSQEKQNDEDCRAIKYVFTVVECLMVKWLKLWHYLLFFGPFLRWQMNVLKTVARWHLPVMVRRE